MEPKKIADNYAVAHFCIAAPDCKEESPNETLSAAPGNQPGLSTPLPAPLSFSA